jgi:carbon-monoxide dehydrogenase medium subunit
MRDVEHCRPGSLEEASEMLRMLGPGAVVYAGGTDVIPRMKLGKMSPTHLVNIKRIPGLDRLAFDGRTLSIGALVKFNEIIFSPAVREHMPVLAEVSRMIATPQVRNLATVGGNLCNAAPSADIAPILIALGARATIHTPEGRKTMALEDFFKGPGKTALAPGEMLVSVEVGKPPSSTKAAYIKHEVRETLEIAITGVAVSLALSPEGGCADARVVVAACAPTPMRARKAEDILRGTHLEPASIEKAAEAAAREISPIDDVRAGAAYRREMTALSLKRAIRKAMGVPE